MTKLTELIVAQHGPFHTYEFFPPRTEQGFANLIDRIRRMTHGPLRAPVAVSVTWGAGGSTADRTMELCERIVRMGVDVILHLTCTNMPKEKVDQALDVSRKLGHRMMDERLTTIASESSGHLQYPCTARRSA